MAIDGNPHFGPHSCAVPLGTGSDFVKQQRPAQFDKPKHNLTLSCRRLKFALKLSWEVYEKMTAFSVSSSYF
jgi:hypothetical protein